MERVRLKIRKKEVVASYQALLVETIKDPKVTFFDINFLEEIVITCAYFSNLVAKSLRCQLLHLLVCKFSLADH